MPGGDQPISTPVEWAQRKPCIYLNIRVDDLKDPVIKIEKDRVHFKGTGGSDNKSHVLDLELFGEVKPDDSKYTVRGRGAELLLLKADPEGPYWKRLLKEDKKQHWLKVDFDKWQDEDVSDEEDGGAAGGGGGGFGGANFEDMMRQMGGLGGGGLGGPGGPDLGEDFGEDDEDSDDDKLPELEESAEKK